MRNAELVMLPTAARRHTTHLFSSVETAPFDTAAYSRMKFGSGSDARKLGIEMADAFAQEFWFSLCTQACLVIPAPSTSVPVAATLMGWHFKNRLNSLLDYCGHKPVDWDMVHREVTYNDNYSQLGLEERRKLLEDDGRFMNTAFAAGKTLIFVDDVRITGTHEDKLSHMLANLGMENPVIFATYAAYSGDRPAIEHELNHCKVQNGLCVAALSTDPEWAVTTRALRLLLESSPEHWDSIMATMSRLRLEQVFHAAIAKGYSKHEPYVPNFEKLRALLGER